MTPTSSRAFFDAIAARYDRAYGLGAEATRDRMARVIARLPRAPARVLDLGVGTGRELPSLLDAGYDVTGFDVSPAMLAQCARRGRAITLVEGDLWDALPFEDARFHAVIALHGTLAHPPSRPGVHAALGRELSRVLGPGGIFVAEVPSREWLVGVVADEAADARIARTGKDTLVHEDKVANVAIVGVVPSDEEWRAALEPGLDVRFEGIGEGETRIVGRKTG